MPFTNFPQGLTSFGIPLLGDPANIGSGRVFWVNSASGLDQDNRGETKTQAFRTIAFALSKIRPGEAGCTILVAENHVETVTSSTSTVFAANDARIIGFGAGANRPKFVYTTSTAATVSITGSNLTISNIVFDMFTGGLDAVAAAVTLSSPNVQFINCEWQMANSSVQGVSGVNVATGGSGAKFIGCEADATAAAGAAQWLNLAGTVSNIQVVGCRIRGNFSAACIVSAGTALELSVRGNEFVQRNAVKAVWNFANASTGMVSNNTCQGTGWATAADVLLNSTGMKFIQNFGFDDATGAVSGVLVPAAGTLS